MAAQKANSVVLIILGRALAGFGAGEKIYTLFLCVLASILAKKGMTAFNQQEGMMRCFQSTIEPKK